MTNVDPTTPVPPETAVAVAAGVALLVPVRAAQVAAPATQATNDVE